jgi:glycosyltransferase involved in cell wall biosynthesis/SAM-dependent methyltransferase
MSSFDKGAIAVSKVVSGLKKINTGNSLALARDRVAQAYVGKWGDNETIEKVRKRVHWVTSQVMGPRVLDVGTSEGIVPILLGREGFMVVGIDINADAIEYANGMLANEAEAVRERVKFLNVSLFQNDTETLFDTVIMGEILEHVSNAENFIETGMRHLAPQGMLIITTPFGVFPDVDHKHTYYLSDIRRLLAPRGRVEHLSVVDGYIRVVLRNDGQKTGQVVRKGKNPLNGDLLLTISEEATYNSQNTLWQRLDKVEQTAKLLKEKADALTQKMKTAAEHVDKLTNALREEQEKAEKFNAERAEAEKRHESAAEQVDTLANALREEQEKSAIFNKKFNNQITRENHYKKRIDDLNKINIINKERHKKYISFQLGSAIIQATKSWRGLAKLPAAIIRVHREAKRRRKAGRLKVNPTEPSTKPSIPETEKESPELAARRLALMAEKFKAIEDRQQSRLRVATVMDEFTFHSYDPECELLQLHPETCVQQLADFKPDLLFIESAWKGAGDLWKQKLTNNGPEINSCINWCNENKVPTLFWNKEDPIHFGVFLPLARKIDYVFTTEFDCIPKYKQKLGHDRCYLLPFAAQTDRHNPIERYERKDAFNFAGSYYLRYLQRQRDFGVLVDNAATLRPVEIYDRNFGIPHSNYTFPEIYEPMILGKLPFDNIDKAYKGYRYGINLNSVKQSQTMFARRVFELLASNTIVVSNFSRGVRLMFGDLVVSSDDGNQLHKQLQDICDNEITYRKLRLMGLRKVMSEHTYAHRLAYIRAKLSHQSYKPQLATVAVFAIVHSIEERAQTIAHFQRQTHEARTLFLVQRFEDDAPIVEPNIRSFADVLSCRKELEVALQTTSFFAVFVPQDYYGPSYLTDLVLANTYSPASAFGKIAQYQAVKARCKLRRDGTQYRPAYTLKARAAIIRCLCVRPDWLDGCLAEPETATLRLEDMLATDEFHYCHNGAALSDEVLCEAVGDLPLANQGVSLNHAILPMVASIPANSGTADTDDWQLPQIGALELFNLMPKPASARIKLDFEDNLLNIKSSLQSNKITHLYTDKHFTREELNLVLDSQYQLVVSHFSGDIKAVFVFQDEKGEKISHAINGSLGDRHWLMIPENCKTIRFGLRIQGAGEASIKGLNLGNICERPAAVIGQSPYLVVTGQYPSYDDLYRYGFLHSRVRAYRQNGLAVDVFRMMNNPEQTYREFEGIDITQGDGQLLDDMLSSGRYENVLVHILNEKIWRVLERHLDRIRVTVWAHGSEIQVWQRRAFEFDRMSEKEVERQKKLSDNRKLFWRSILMTPHSNLQLVFISQYLLDGVTQDFEIDLPKQQTAVVHNYIDGTIFDYVPKMAGQRKKVLSIRPYASLTYANDLTVKVILELSKINFFEDLEFYLVGDGPLFQDVTAPLRKFSNVKLEQRFLTHAEIAELHKAHGIFLTPTRMDSQGVSRDEAMSSGLVPITTNVAAIPEFVDDTCGIIVPPEDYKAMAEGIEFLYRNPQEFLNLSKAAAERVRAQSGFAQTIGVEMKLIQPN